MVALNKTAPGVQVRLPGPRITPREADVLYLVGKPYTNGQIAVLLGVSRRTVESHVSALLRKLAVADRAHLIRASDRLLYRPTPLPVPIEDAAAEQPGHASLPGAATAMRRRLASQRTQGGRRRIEQAWRDSLAVHEAAADRFDALAVYWQQLARIAPGAGVDALRNADAARRYGEAARTRAARVRQRLDEAGRQVAHHPAAGEP